MQDFEALAGIDQGSYLILLIAALVPALKIGQLVFHPSREALAKSARWNLFFIVLFMLVLVGKLVVTWVMFHSFGWVFVKEKLLGFLPMILVPAAVASAVSVPRLWRLVRGGFGSSGIQGEEVSIEAKWHDEASSPQLVVPIQATALGALAAAALQFLLPSIMLEPHKLAFSWGFLVVGSALLWLWRSWLQKRFAVRGELTRPRPLIRFLRGTLVVLVLAAGSVTWFNQATKASLLPDAFNMTDHTHVDHGVASASTPVAPDGHAQHISGQMPDKTVSVTELTGPQEGIPDRKFTMTAQKTTVTLSSGKTVEAWSFNGQYPGPQLRMKQGELVEVVLENKDISDGVTIHWHGLHVPNAEDGVAGATQDAVLPGEKHVYRFVAEQSGTYWYHSHQQSSLQVKKGLLGAIVIEPKEQSVGATRELTLVHHKLDQAEAVLLNGSDTLTMDTVEPGTPVRLRLINAHNFTASYQLQGTPFQVVAIDGNDVNEPNLIANHSLKLAAGGRYDIAFTMPNRPVSLAQSHDASGKGLLLRPNGVGEVPGISLDLPVFDPARYGSPQPLPFDLSTPYDREYQMIFDVQFGFYDGQLDGLWTINGKVFPDTPMLMVKEGDLVKTTFVNRSFMDHPMHLHGHHMLVLSRNGKPVTGSPWWTDTLNVAPGETYEVAFRADNPGLWMDHCHNPDHAALGMTMQLLYEGVTSPYQVGRSTRNHPE